MVWCDGFIGTKGSEVVPENPGPSENSFSHYCVLDYSDHGKAPLCVCDLNNEIFCVYTSCFPVYKHVKARGQPLVSFPWKPFVLFF